MAAIKARRDVMAVLTPEQRAKEKSEHDKVMEQHKGSGASWRDDAVWHESSWSQPTW